MNRLAIATAPRRDSRHWEQDSVTWDELLAWADEPASVKEAGNYLLGTLRPDTIVTHKGESHTCKNLHRRKDFVVSRSGVTLDVDAPGPGFADQVELLFPYAALLHTTFSSSPDEPRYRMVIPTDREMAPDEYVVVATSVMQDLGAEQFDPGTTQPERYMYRPAAQEAGWFRAWKLDGPALPVDEVLADFEEDLSAKPMPKPHRNKRNPFELDGVIGAFNRAYADWDLLIETYDLPYNRVDEDRYQLVGARSIAGMGPVAPGLVFSHHVSDPAFDQACSAFDLVRLHRFGDLDEQQPASTPINRRPSHLAMADLAAVDPRVTADLVGEDFDALLDDTAEDAWKLGLQVSRQGRLLDVIGNWDLFVKHDPVFQALYFNELSLAIEIDRDLPWRKISEGGEVFGMTDRKDLVAYLERVYRFKAPRERVNDTVDTCAARRRVNPIRDYLDALTWDGVPRIETCLPGVAPTPFTRMVARKSMVAAVARIYDPGCKWDHALVLYGSEGLGKSWWIEKVSRGFSASLGSITQKDTLLTMQRSWIMVSDEGHSLRKDDSDVQKEFLTRTEDVFRMPYDRETVVHKRHCVVWSTTNDETFLRRQEGNRRFLIVHCEGQVDFDAMTDEYVGQLWAEARDLYRAGERLFLDDLESEVASEERERFVEEDALGGVINEYLETPVPADWDERAPEARQAWLRARADGFEAPGTERITRCCTTQIWVEALGRRIGDHRRVDLLEISTALKRLPGWKVLPGRHRLPGYGPQTIFTRD